MATFCPICKRLVSPPDGLDPASGTSHFPFCSDRCKLIDLGRWLDGKYQIPAAEDDLDESTDADQHLPDRST